MVDMAEKLVSGDKKETVYIFENRHMLDMNPELKAWEAKLREEGKRVFNVGYIIDSFFNFRRPQHESLYT